MFDQPKPKLRLFDGATVYLNIGWHPRPIFMCDAIKHGLGFNIAGYIYDPFGEPISQGAPEIRHIVEYQ